MKINKIDVIYPEIKARETMNKKKEKKETVKTENIHKDSIIKEKLPDDLYKRLQNIYEKTYEANPTTFSEFEKNISRDNNPEREISIWENIAQSYFQYVSIGNFNLKEKREMFNFLLSISTEVSIGKFSNFNLSESEKEKLITLYFNNDEFKDERNNNTQLPLFRQNPRKFCASIGLNWSKVIWLYKSEYLSFNPEKINNLDYQRCSEIRFLAHLIHFGCSELNLRKLLKNLKKPYNYNAYAFCYNFAKEKWHLSHSNYDVGLIEYINEYISNLEIVGDLEELNELKSYLDMSINRLQKS